MSVNKAILVGRLGRVPEIRSTGGGKKVANFSIATDETYKNREGEKVKSTEWHRIVLWDKLAEIAEEYLHKGDLVYLEGKIATRQYEDKRDGSTKQTTEVIANVMRMLGSKREAGASEEAADEASPF